MPTCPSCAEENPERARFCLACGTALTEPAARAEERKVVSVLFVDLVGFTAGADQADPEDVRATLRPYHARVAREIERFGGTVEKFVGDAVMAVFGAPVAHEDDAERAVRAALRILDAIGELNEHEGLDLAARAAVATGEAVVSLEARSGTGEGIATGDVVNTASRLQSEAPTGGLVVGEQTYRATRDVIDYEELPPVAVKGKAEPVPLWRAVAARSRFGIDVDAPSTPFVGRGRELRLLQDTYERMVEEAEIQLVTLVGEPGVGKTRLLAELRHWVDDRAELVIWRQGRCLPYGDGITFWALGEIIKAHAGILESDGAAEAAAKLEAVVEGMDEPSWLRDRLGPLVGLSGGEADREESFTAWQRFLEAIAATHALVLLFEDLHWADPSLLAFVERLVDWSRGLPILVICTGRPELFERHPTWGGGTRNSTTVSLSPLSISETEQLVFGLLETAVLPAETKTALLERSGGNPLYAEEYVRLFLEGVTDELPMPETVHGIIAARLDTLPPERKALLQDAAVIGKVFWAGAVAEMGDREPDAVRDALHQLARKELVRPARASSVEGEPEYAFWHALIRDVAYGQIPRAQRAAKHIAAAEWVERIAGERVADHAELIAFHYTEALAARQAAGEISRELELMAARFLVLGGDRSLDLDLRHAESLYSRALELSAPGTIEHARALVRLGESVQVAGRFHEAERLVAQGAEELEAMGDPREVADAYGLLGQLNFQLGNADGMEAALTRALALLEPLPPGPDLVEIYGRMTAVAPMKGGSPEIGIDWANKAIALGEELGLRRELIRARQWRGIFRCELGDLAGIEDLEQALADAIELRTMHVVSGHVNLADQVWRQRGPAPALDILRAGIEYRVSRGSTPPVWPRAESCWMLYDLGQWDELLHTADDLLAFEQEHGAAQPGAMALAYKALTLIWRKQLDDAEVVVRQVLQQVQEVEDVQVVGPALIGAAFAAASRFDLGTAGETLQRWQVLTQDRPFCRTQNLTDAVRIACAVPDLDLADRMLAHITTAAERDRLSDLTARATIAAARGEDATALFTEAAAGWKAFGCRLEHALALRGAGEEAAAAAILDELGVPPTAGYTAARTAK